MTIAQNNCATHGMSHDSRRSDVVFRTLVVGLIGFLTLVDLFATQAILPTLAERYDVMPATMGFAVNASTIGMAFSGLAVGLVGRRLNRRRGIWLCLALLSIPTALLAFAPDISTFTALRIIQGIFMAGAFTLTMAYLAERCTAPAATSALAAYVTGGVASNLIGRLMAGSIADSFGLAQNFYVFALLNLAGAVLVFFTLKGMPPMQQESGAARSPLASWVAHGTNPALRASFGLGFLILFAFIGTFTYVNFVLARAPFNLSPMALGLVYFVFLPSMITTPFAGRTAQRIGARATFWAALFVAGIGLPLLLLSNLIAVLAGLVLIGIGTFFAQAAATGFVGRAAMGDRASASGLYLASYYLGGLTGATVIGQIFDHLGWGWSVVGIAISLALAALLAAALRVHAPNRNTALASHMAMPREMH